MTDEPHGFDLSDEERRMIYNRLVQANIPPHDIERMTRGLEALPPDHELRQHVLSRIKEQHPKP